MATMSGTSKNGRPNTRKKPQPQRLRCSPLCLGPHLTPREREVCEAIVRLHAIDAVAEELGISRDTVRSHLKTLKLKLGVRLNPEIREAAVREGILSGHATSPALTSKTCLAPQPAARRGQAAAG